jgi:hypothetical protein
MTRININVVRLLTLTLALSCFSLPVGADAKSKCTKNQLKQYEKAKFQYINSNTMIQISREIKKIVEDARQKKVALLGRFVDYSAKDLYTLNQQDASIRDAEDHRDSWEPTLKTLAKKCGFPMTSKSEVKGESAVSTAPSQPTPTPSTYSKQFLKIQDYFDRISGTYFNSSRQFSVSCINDARRDGIIDGLKVYLAISSNSFSLQTGQEWFPVQLSNAYVNKVKTWTSSSKPHLYIELPFSAPDENRNPCGLTVDNVPRLSEIGLDVNSAQFLVAGPTGYAVATTKAFTKADLGG